MKKLIPLLFILPFLPSCASWRGYTGPTLRFSAGYEGFELGFTLAGKRGATGAEMVEAIKRLGIFEEPPKPEVTK